MDNELAAARDSPHERLRMADDRLQVIVDAMSAAVTLCSRDLRYLWVSKTYAAWLGRRVVEIVDQPIDVVLGAAALAAIRPHINEIVVSDTGIGIPPEFLPHMFERFRQADAGTTRQHGGLGLGLAITRHLVEMHGGTVHAASGGPGVGATFRLKLPVMIVHPEAETERRVHPRDARSEHRVPIPNLKDVRVLAVDDDSDALLLVAEILEAAGAQVTAVDSGPAAITALESLRPDVLLADLGMPHMDGFELIAQIRKANIASLRDMPAAALTAYARSDDRARALRSGFQMHLSKPIDPEELMAAVAALAKRNNPD